MISILSQSRFPEAWLFAQKLIGGTPDKKRLALRHYAGQQRILEIGCSVGNLADAFLNCNGAEYTGIDIDEAALAVARRRFAGRPTFSFRGDSLEALKAEGGRWDYVLIAGVLHHVDDATARAMLESCARLCTPGGCVVVSEPVPLRPGDGAAFRFIHSIEQGQFLRETATLMPMIKEARLTITDCEEPLIGPGITSSPKIMRFALIRAVPTGSPAA